MVVGRPIQFSADASKTLRTANELHLPVGVPVRIILHSNDVIHSFWVPSLAGKQDLIPGRDNDITIVPTKVGIYRGQCAEFCGTQHAHMALDVNVDSYARLRQMVGHSCSPRRASRRRSTQAGYNYVTTRPVQRCATTSRGTPAGGTRRARPHPSRQPPQHRRRHACR